MDDLLVANIQLFSELTQKGCFFCVKTYYFDSNLPKNSAGVNTGMLLALKSFNKKSHFA